MRLDKEQTLKLMAKAREQSQKQALQCSAYILLNTILAVYNGRSKILPSKSGGLHIPNCALFDMSFGFDGDAFIVGFQEPTYKAIKHLDLEMGWVEEGSQSFCLNFAPVCFGANTLPELRLSFNVLLPRAFDLIQQCNYVTTGLSEVIDGERLDITEVISPAAVFLNKRPVGGIHKKLGFESLI